MAREKGRGVGEERGRGKRGHRRRRRRNDLHLQARGGKFAVVAELEELLFAAATASESGGTVVRTRVHIELHEPDAEVLLVVAQLRDLGGGESAAPAAVGAVVVRHGRDDDDEAEVAFGRRRGQRRQGHAGLGHDDDLVWDAIAVERTGRDAGGTGVAGEDEDGRIDGQGAVVASSAQVE